MRLLGILALTVLATTVLIAAPAGAAPKNGVGRGRDTTPPTITCPSAITAQTTFSWGTSVSFTVTATDDKDPSPDLVVSPRSGSQFPVGTTTVTATATDWKGNTSSRTFDVTVLPFTQPLPLEGVRTYKAYWPDSQDSHATNFFEWDITVAADGTVSGTAYQTQLLIEHEYDPNTTFSDVLPSGLSGEGVMSGTIAADGSGQFTSSATYWVWIYGDYDADGNPVYTQRTASFSGPAGAYWDSSPNLQFEPDPLAAPSPSYTNGWLYLG